MLGATLPLDILHFALTIKNLGNFSIFWAKRKLRSVTGILQTEIKITDHMIKSTQIARLDGQSYFVSHISLSSNFTVGLILAASVDDDQAWKIYEFKPEKYTYRHP